MSKLTGLFLRGTSYYLKVVLPLDHPAREQYRSGRKVVALGPSGHREAVKAGTLARARILAAQESPATLQLPIPAVAARLPNPGSLKLRLVYDRWCKAKKRSADSVAACGRALSLYETHSGNPPIAGLTRLQGDAFRAWLQEPERGTSSKTARDRFTWVKSLLKYAHRDLGLLTASPWEGLDIEAKTSSRRRPWTGEELRLLFSQPIYAAYELPTAWNAGKDAAYWLPLLGIYSGARLSELAQLSPGDVAEDDGIRYLELSDELPGQHIKTDAGRRRIPIHPELVRLGFLTYVKARKGCASLWPDLPKREGKPGGFFSQWFGQYRRSLGLGERPDFHCFRHSVRTELAKANIREDTIDILVGHEVSGSTGARVYTHRPLSLLQEAVEAISYPALPLLLPWFQKDMNA